MNRRGLLMLGLAASVLAALLLLAACTPASPPAATQAPAAQATTAPAAPATSAPAAQATAPAAATPAAKPTEAAKPAASPAAATTPTAAAPAAAKPAPPKAILEIVPVPANAADPNAIKATLPAPTPISIAMGTTGLANVSIGVPVTLKGSAADPKAPAKGFQWTLTTPTTSKAKLTNPEKDVTAFTPDVAGIYKVDLVVKNDAGTSPMESVQIHAGAYIGVEKGNCASCHGAKVAEWSKTGHGIIFKREIDGGADPKTSHYNEGCVRCHTTGYYAGVANGGFADVQQKTGWKFPDLAKIQTGKGNWDAVPADLKAVANIQCESCHGPAADHVAGKAKMATSLDEGVCNQCHNGGGHHVKGAMFQNAKHGEADSQAFTYPTGPSRQACVRCHSGEGFISFIQNPKEMASWNNEPAPVTCAVCHDPHSESQPMQLRITGKPVEVQGVTKDFGLSAVCVECHNARTTGADAVKGGTPHYSAAAELLSGVGGVDYGQKVPDTAHGQIIGTQPIKDPADKEGKTMLFGGQTPGACVACHMWPTISDAKDPNQYKVGDHSFNMTSPDGKFQYTAACQSCHAGVKDFNFPAKADYDGNGKVETVQQEVAGLLTTLQKAIADSGVKPIQGHPYFDQKDTANANAKQRNAIYNYLFVRGLEGSDGKAAAIHNFKRSVALLQLSYKDLTGKDVPNATIMK